MITDQDYTTAAVLLSCEVKAIKAVAQVESKGSGFLSDGELMILFEPHIFYRELVALKIKPVISDICYPEQGTKPYGKYSEQWGKLNLAAAINKEAAYKAASYGKFQALGKYHKECGFDTVFQMVDQYKKGEGEHLMGFVRMVKSRSLVDELQRKDWVAFAKAYNGAGYKINKYDEKLQEAYNSFN